MEFCSNMWCAVPICLSYKKCKFKAALPHKQGEKNTSVHAPPKKPCTHTCTHTLASLSFSFHLYLHVRGPVFITIIRKLISCTLHLEIDNYKTKIGCALTNEETSGWEYFFNLMLKIFKEKINLLVTTVSKKNRFACCSVQWNAVGLLNYIERCFKYTNMRD